MQIEEFAVERWMDRYETTCRYNLAETCVESLTVRELLELAGKKATILDELLPMRLTYGAIEGSDRLRGLVASMYRSQRGANVVITHGAIGGNALVYHTLIEPGDEVVTLVPIYQQHYSIPESLGATIKLLHLREANCFLPDLEELASLVTARTKVIALSNPNNPTGALMDRPMLEAIAGIADGVGAYVLSDEVYRGTDQEGSGTTESMADLYRLGISSGSMSKAFSLAGLRLGWIAGPTELIGRVGRHRDYNTISVGMLDDHFASIALDNRDKILTRSRAIVRSHLQVLDRWLATEPSMSYIKPRSGTTAAVKYTEPVSSEAFCVRLVETTGVMFTPGSALGMEGYVRIGYANNRTVLEQGLAEVSQYLNYGALV